MNNGFKPSGSGIWDELASHRQSLQEFRLAEQFASDPDRFLHMHESAAGLILDYSKNLVTHETVALLVKAAGAMGLGDKIEDLFRGRKVNITEGRPALHTALRDFTGTAPFSAEVDAAMSAMAALVAQIESGQWRGATGKPVRDVVNIGIGGSHLGPMMVADALGGFSADRPACHFVSNIDSTDIHSVLARLAPETTLFVVSSKSFTTQETLHNAATAKAWLQEQSATEENAVSAHFLAVTASPEKAIEFGITPDNILPMWDWVGGRYSLWSAIGIAAALRIGNDNFNRMRRGAALMDSHFRHTPFASNMPVLLGLLGIWYGNYWGSQSHAVLPYNQHLRFFPEFLQQLEMESNGKSASLNHDAVSYATGAVLWGTVETNGQHSFHQLLHQGTRLVPVDFIVSLRADREGDTHHPYLFANCLAQANALMTGRGMAELEQETGGGTEADQQSRQMAIHRYMPGNRPSTTILMERFTPETLGALIALYEHKVYVQSIIWNINAFDQWGVELGKQVSNQVYARLGGAAKTAGFDPSTEALIGLYRDANK